MTTTTDVVLVDRLNDKIAYVLIGDRARLAGHRAMGLNPWISQIADDHYAVAPVAEISGLYREPIRFDNALAARTTAEVIARGAKEGERVFIVTETFVEDGDGPSTSTVYVTLPVAADAFDVEA